MFDLDGHGDAIAAIDAESDRWFTYAELAAHAKDFAANVATPEKRLAFLYADNSLDMLVAYHGLLESGHAVCLLDRALSPARRSALEEIYRPSIVVEGGHTTILDGPSVEVHPDLAVLLSTSGSTGSAKLVRLSKNAVRANAEAIVESLQITNDDRTITSLPPSYSFGLSVLNSYALAGASLVFTKHGLVTGAFWSALSTHQCTSLSGVPFAYEALIKLRIDLRVPQSLRVMTQAGGRLALPTAEKFHGIMTKRGGRFYVMYGQTEATARMSCLPSEDFTRKKGSCGKAIPGGAFTVENGEVVYHGPNVMMGYASAAEDLARGDELGGTLRTGDLGVLDEEGFLTITGRIKRIVKINGTRFSLDEIEAIAKVPVVAHEDRVFLFCETEDTAPILAQVKEALGVTGDAIQARTVAAIPTTPNGKPDYTTLSEWAAR